MNHLRHAVQFPGEVRSLTLKYVKLWSAMSAELPSGMARYTVRQKLNRKRQIESVLRNAPVSLDSYVVCDAARRQSARGLVMRLVMNALAQGADTRMRSFFDNCERATDQCIKDARTF